MVNCFNSKSPPPPPLVRVIKNDGKSTRPQLPSDKSGLAMSNLQEYKPLAQEQKQPEQTYPMTNAELAEAIEYARQATDKIAESVLRKRMQEQAVTLLDLQAKRAMAVKA